jgi:hypothetical protein
LDWRRYHLPETWQAILVYCGMVEEKESVPFSAAGSEVVNCFLTFAIKASVEFFCAASLLDAAVLGGTVICGITTVLV